MNTFSVRLIMYIGMFLCVDSNSIDEYVKHVCGGENKCYNGERNSSLPSDSCCRPCECNSICNEKGTCCSGTIFHHPGNVTKQACLQSVKRAKTSQDVRIFPRYYVRAKCPRSYLGQLTRAKCERDEPDSILDIPFVSSMDGKVIYRNRHCAACFGEFDVIPWKIVIDWKCIKEVFSDYGGNWNSVNVSLLMDKLATTCSLPFERPNITLPKYSQCHGNIDLISSCPEVNSMNQFPNNLSQELKEMCANDKSSLTFFDSKGKGYANVYCYLCNNKGTKVTCASEIQKRITFDMSFLLRIEPITESSTDEVQERLCNDEEFYDEYFGECKQLRCPMFEVLIHGRCVSIVESSRLRYGFNFEIVPIFPLKWKNPEIHVFFDLLPELLKSWLKFGNCAICSVSVDASSMTTNSVEKFYLQIVFTTSPYCELKKVLSTAAKLEEMEKGNQNSTIVIKSVPFQIKYIWSYEKYRNLIRNHKTIYGGKFICGHGYLNPSKFENCPKITLRTDEYSEIANTSQMLHVHVARSDEGGYEICLDDYEAFINNEKSNGKPMTIAYFSVSLAVVTAVLLRAVMT